MHNFTKGMRVRDIGGYFDCEDTGVVVKVEGPYVHVLFDEYVGTNIPPFVFEEGFDLQYLEEIK